MAAEATAHRDEIPPNGMANAAQAELRGAHKFLFFDDREAILCSSSEAMCSTNDLSQLKSIFQASREDALRVGVRMQNQRYEVHHLEPPLVYGRTMMGDPVHSEGFVVCKVDAGPTGFPAYGVVTFVCAPEPNVDVPHRPTFDI